MKTCPTCQSNQITIAYNDVSSVYSSHPYDIGHCRACKHYFTSPAPTPTDLDDIYNNRYSYDAHTLIKGEKTMRAKHYANYIANHKLGSSALEVGCMHGLLLTQLQSRGLIVEGVELDEGAVNYCQKNGLSVQRSSIENYLHVSSSPHDVIVMSHVIEHIVDPEAQLKGLGSKLNNCGSLVLITPNSAAFSRRLFGRFWGYWQVPVHINHFNANSITTLLERSGYEVTKVKTYGADSLFFLSTLANLFGANSETKSLSGPKKTLVRISTIVLRPWFWIGAEDMLVVARAIRQKDRE